MGKRLFQEVYASQDRTDALALPELIVVSEEDDRDTVDFTYHTVHKSYFSKEKVVCPYCRKSNTTETKIRSRKFKDILPSENSERKVIDLIFHQRYFRCDDCNRVFREDIDFAEEGCRYTNRLSDLLAEGTLTQTYEKVCKEYGVPASKTSVGVKTFEGAIELDDQSGSWAPTNPKRAGAKKEKLSPLDEIIQRINEEFMGEFTDADRVIVEDLYNRMKKDEDVQKAAQTDDQQVYHRSVFPGIFDETAMAAYMENQEAYIQLFQDAKKYHAVQAALADMLYRDLHDKKS